ncbi:murein L,D-transpeptidase family protein [Phaeobacter sp. HF9A]|uniref:L,D-transpeptidase family protein n=1 Tax=Phaeobacter sp. HF9A TaxID=2721561 RepID=UPI001430A9BD|nr:L,D-transpeptidase family protein [Phaeobacter sp. HF9A]NIZ11841.1 L,D-transpeptidase family protein [Phaeobacter sp. HF9A]
MHRRTFGVGILAALGTAGCSSGPHVSRYNGPPVTSIVVNKGARKLYLLNEHTVLREYQVGLGFAPLGHKQLEGDGRTPEGTYLIDRRNPRSKYHLSLGISYPNAADRAAARALGVRPGGDIFIHGEPNSREDRKRAARVQDWTAGCIAVRNEEIEEIWSMVTDGTLITLRP